MIFVSTHFAELYPSYNDKWWVRARIQESTCLLSESVLFPSGREVWSHPDSGSISSPSGPGRGAGKNKEGLTWPSPSTLAFSCFACPLVEMPFSWQEKSRHRSGMLTKWGICWMMTSVGSIFTLKANTKPCCPWVWESRSTLDGRVMMLLPQLAQLTALSSSSSRLNPSFILSFLFLRGLAGLWSLIFPTLTYYLFFDNEGVVSRMWLSLACIILVSKTVFQASLFAQVYPMSLSNPAKSFSNTV